MLKKIRHIGIVVEDLERAISKFEAFGLSCSEKRDSAKVGLRAAFLPIGETMIELHCYTRPAQGNEQVLRSPNGSIDHICFEVDDLGAKIKEFERNGAKLVEGFPRTGAHGRIAFFYPETTEGVLIEICQV